MKEFIPQTLLVVIGAFIGIVGTLGIDSYQNRLKFIEYTVYESNEIFSPVYENIGNDQVSIEINKNKIDNVSELTVNIFNLTNTDFSDVPIFLELYNKDEDGQQINVISSQYFDPNKSKEAITTIDSLKPSFKNGLRYGFLLNPVNRQEDLNNPFTLKFLIKGKKTPEVLVQTNKAGLGIKKIDKEEEYTISKSDQSWIKIFFSVMSVLTLLILILTLVISRTRRNLIDSMREMIERQRLEIERLNSVMNGESDNKV
jgi:hypothetical protein